MSYGVFLSSGQVSNGLSRTELDVEFPVVNAPLFSWMSSLFPGTSSFAEVKLNLAHLSCSFFAGADAVC